MLVNSVRIYYIKIIKESDRKNGQRAERSVGALC